jgi:DedD protein
MDRRVKERLVGASILVVLIVLIVPELLSGPAPAPAASTLPLRTPAPVRNVTVDVATSKTQTPQQASADSPAPSVAAASDAAPGALASGASAPAALASGASAQAPASAAATPAPAPAPAPSAPLENTRPPPTSAATAGRAAIPAHSWAVQLGSFASHENADKLARQLKSQGYAVFVLPGGSGSSLRYRVRVGPMADRGAAAQTAAKLKAIGHTASLVAPGP